MSAMGVVDYVRDACPPKSKFSVDDIPDLKGKVIVVTGANTGVGKETAKALLAHNAKVYIAARNQEKAEEAIKDLKSETGNEAIFLKLDLGDLKSVKASAEEFLSKEPELHILFNNAGVMMPPVEQLTTQGYDLQFGTNVLGHFGFTTLLIPALIAGAKSSPDGKARILNTSSTAAYFTKTIDFDTVSDTPARTKRGTTMLYAQSKFGNAVLSNELARRYADQGIVSMALNPGNLKSDLQRYMKGVEALLMNAILYPTPFGALTQLWGAVSVEGAALTGKFLIPWARQGNTPTGADNEKLGEKLWKWAEEEFGKI